MPGGACRNLRIKSGVIDGTSPSVTITRSRALERQRSTAERRGQPVLPALTDERLGTAEPDAVQQLRCARSEHDHDPGELLTWLCASIACSSNGRPFERFEQLRTIPEASALPRRPESTRRPRLHGASNTSAS